MSRMKLARIVVGSLNPVKIAAAEKTFQPYGASHLDKITICGLPAKSGVREQPISLEETIVGATRRATDALTLDILERGDETAADLSVGVESGVFSQKLADCSVEMFEVCVCALVRRRIPDCRSRAFVGLSSAWVVPPKIARRLVAEHIDLDEAAFREDLTEKRKIGKKEGLIGLLSKGCVTREDQVRQAIEAALIQMNCEGE